MSRLAKIISNSGVCSRRQAEIIISEGRVKVNNTIINSPSINVTLNDVIEVDGNILTNDTTPRLWTYYKPIGLITTNKDPQGRPTIFENLKDLPRVISIGRLDLKSEGLLLLTNNGDLSRKFELPSNFIKRIYKVRAYGDTGQISKFIKNKKYSITIDNINYHINDIRLLTINKQNKWFEVSLCEGKNREIRKIFEYFGLQVNRLIRTKYGPFDLGDLNPGQYKEQSIKMFKDFLNL